MFSVWLIDGFNAFSKFFIKSCFVKNGHVERSCMRSRISTLSRKSICLYCFLCRLFALHRYFFYYTILYAVREVVTGKMRNLQKSIEKVAICAEKSVEKVAILTKIRLKNAKSAKSPLKKSNGCKIRLKNHLPFFVYVLLSFAFMKITD